MQLHVNKHVYEIGKTQSFNLFFERAQKIPKDIEKTKEIFFSFDILRSIRTF
jgi:hypothetical protein